MEFLVVFLQNSLFCNYFLKCLGTVFPFRNFQLFSMISLYFPLKQCVCIRIMEREAVRFMIDQWMYDFNSLRKWVCGCLSLLLCRETISGNRSQSCKQSISHSSKPSQRNTVPCSTLLNVLSNISLNDSSNEASTTSSEKLFHGLVELPVRNYFLVLSLNCFTPRLISLLLGIIFFSQSCPKSFPFFHALQQIVDGIISYSSKYIISASIPSLQNRPSVWQKTGLNMARFFSIKCFFHVNNMKKCVRGLCHYVAPGSPNFYLQCFSGIMQKLVTFSDCHLKQYLFLAEYSGPTLVVCHISWLQGMFCNVAGVCSVLFIKQIIWSCGREKGGQWQQNYKQLLYYADDRIFRGYLNVCRSQLYSQNLQVFGLYEDR